MIIGNREFNMNNAYIMGILNITPDSFSDGGNYNNMDAALKQTEKMILEGADIIDIGGESTRPDAAYISADEELDRIIPVILEIKKHFDHPISVDTYKASVAKAAIEAGADMINDIWGLKYDKDMASVISKGKIACCLMHNKNDKNYSNLIEDIKNDLEETLLIAKEANISTDKIIIDPGIGFAKTLEQNLKVMKHLEEFQIFNLPILLGTSRKSMIGLTLNLPVEERLEGTLATTVLGFAKGCRFFRVHDVKANKRAVEMTEAMLKG